MNDIFIFMCGFSLGLWVMLIYFAIKTIKEKLQ